ncbi:hypothetical protein BST36_08195 [Mycolicibacterium moriokaense]|nr:hypothetical protein BST36_08195 [Mycolicibacterium moriokaense]
MRRRRETPRYLVWEPRRMSLVGFLDDAARWADREFLVEAGRRVTYRDHAAAVNRAAAMMAARGVGPNARVLVLSANHIEAIVVWWAALWLDAVAVMGNAWWSSVEIKAAIDEVDPVLIVVDDKRMKRVSTTAAIVMNLAEFEDDEATGRDTAEPPPGLLNHDEDRPATVIFTSGTTGHPRGVVLSHRSLISTIHNLLYASRQLPQQLTDDTPAKSSLLGVPFFHMSGMQSMLVGLLTGAKLVLPSGGAFDARATLDLIQNEKLTSFAAVPTVMGRLVNHPDTAEYDLSSVKSINMGGMPIPQSLLPRVRALFPAAAERVSTMYGLSESGGPLTTCSSRDLRGRPWSSGSPLPVVELRIDGPGEDMVGEVVARSPGNMNQYWGGMDATVLDEDGWLHTGDLGRLRDGHLQIVGRSKDVIVRAGENVASPHVEACLLSHPEVREAAVFALDHDDLGEEVAAVVVLVDGSSLNEYDLKAYAAQNLASFEVPSAWWIRNTALPLNASGKASKTQLKSEWPHAGTSAVP